jgi:ABC-type lipoprotein release transport system permease subunit
VLFGCLLAAGISKYVTSHLYAVKGTDPATFIMAGGVLVGVAAVASWLPAARGARGNPILALRPE